MTETNSRFLRLRSRNRLHPRYDAPGRAEDAPEHAPIDFRELADRLAADSLPFDLRAHTTSDGGES